MQRLLTIALFVCVANLAFVCQGTAWAIPTRLPPVSTGPQTLSGFGGGANAHSFFIQSGSSFEGDITGVGSGTLWRVEILGIDMSGITGGSSRTIDFVLQNAGIGQPNHNLRVSATLGNGITDSEMFVAQGGAAPQFADGSSIQDLVPGDLTIGKFDLRYAFAKTQGSDPWTVTPMYRLGVPNFSWTPFSGGSYTTVLGNQDFTSARFDVAFNQGAGGILRFDNYSLFAVPPVAPVPEPSTLLLLGFGLSGLAAWRYRSHNG